MANVQISRRQLFRGDLSAQGVSARPPWAVPEDAFAACCDRCGDCVPACPERIIRITGGGFPEVDFTIGGCSFCGECRTACGGKALLGDPRNEPPWRLVARIGPGCLANRGVVCRSCGEACDEGAIRFRLRVGTAAEPRLNSGICTGCGYCVSVCPAQAVKIETPEPSAIAVAGQGNPKA